MSDSFKIVELFSEEQIKSRVIELAQEIAKDYPTQDIVLIGVMQGGTAFMSDLSRELWRVGMTTRVSEDYIGMSSYAGGTESRGEVTYTKNLARPIADRDVIVVEDIVDTGLTLKTVIDELSKLSPRSIKTVSLLSKPSKRKIEVKIDYLGFEIENHFVIGYGLDYEEKYRNMPYIGYVVFD